LSVEIDVSERDDHAVVKVRGEVDLTSSSRLREALVDLTEVSEPKLVVDLEEVGFIDSTGIGVLVGGVKRARNHGGDLSLVCTQRRILKVLEITGLVQVFEVHSSLADAVA
jgi:anti-sigma B factor antagonist